MAMMMDEEAECIAVAFTTGAAFRGSGSLDQQNKTLRM
jgi:hypothetical protein